MQQTNQTSKTRPPNRTTKGLHLLLVIASLFGYLEWGGSHHAFLYQTEIEVFKKAFVAPSEVLHPLIILPIAGQIALLLVVFQKTPKKILSYFGIATISILLLLMLVVGILGANWKIALAALPFLAISAMVIFQINKA